MELILKVLASKDQQPRFLCKNTFPPTNRLSWRPPASPASLELQWHGLGAPKRKVARPSTQHHVEVAKLVVSLFLFSFFLFVSWFFVFLVGWLCWFLLLVSFFLCRFDCLLFVLWLLVCLVFSFFVYLFTCSFVSGSRWNSVHFALFASRHNIWDVIDVCSCHVSFLDGLSKLLGPFT